jgi:hypothetical protein
MDESPFFSLYLVLPDGDPQVLQIFPEAEMTTRRREDPFQNLQPL